MGEDKLTAVGFFIPRYIKRAIEAEASDQSIGGRWVQVGDIFRQMTEDHWRDYVSVEVRSDYERNRGKP